VNDSKRRVYLRTEQNPCLTGHKACAILIGWGTLESRYVERVPQIAFPWKDEPIETASNFGTGSKFAGHPRRARIQFNLPR